MPGTNSAGALSSLVRSIRGPVMLVALGSLFMLDYAGGVSLGRTWPVLLIVFGLLKLLEHVSTKPVGTDPA